MGHTNVADEYQAILVVHYIEFLTWFSSWAFVHIIRDFGTTSPIFRHCYRQIRIWVWLPGIGMEVARLVIVDLTGLDYHFRLFLRVITFT